MIQLFSYHHGVLHVAWWLVVIGGLCLLLALAGDDDGT